MGARDSHCRDHLNYVFVSVWVCAAKIEYTGTLLSNELIAIIIILIRVNVCTMTHSMTGNSIVHLKK